MEAIRIKVWLSEKHRQEPIYIVDDSTVPIMAEFQDAGSVLQGAEVIAYAKYGDKVQSATCTVDGSTAAFTPSVDFFHPGWNQMQFEIGAKVISFAIDVFCAKRISKGGV